MGFIVLLFYVLISESSHFTHPPIHLFTNWPSSPVGWWTFLLRSFSSIFSRLTNLWHACPEWHAQRFLWHATLPTRKFYISFARPNYLYCEEHTHHSDSVETVYALPLLPNKVQWNIFTQIGSGAKWWLDICHWGAGLAVTGRIRDIGQKVLVFFSNKK
jgi:hypothetical protein